LSGIPLVLLVLSNGGKLLQDLPHALLGQLRRLCGGSGRAGSGRAEQHSPVSGGALFLMLAAYWLCGSLMYVLMEAESQRWSAFEALYYVITCHATLGLGDYEPAQRPIESAAAVACLWLHMVYVLLGIIALGIIHENLRNWQRSLIVGVADKVAASASASVRFLPLPRPQGAGAAARVGTGGDADAEQAPDTAPGTGGTTETCTTGGLDELTDQQPANDNSSSEQQQQPAQPTANYRGIGSAGPRAWGDL
jgi:hypothetical protein